MLVALIIIAHVAGDGERADLGQAVGKRPFQRLRHLHKGGENFRLMCRTLKELAKIAEALDPCAQNVLDLGSKPVEGKSVRCRARVGGPWPWLVLPIGQAFQKYIRRRLVILDPYSGRAGRRAIARPQLRHDPAADLSDPSRIAMARRRQLRRGRESATGRSLDLGHSISMSSGLRSPSRLAPSLVT